MSPCSTARAPSSCFDPPRFGVRQRASVLSTPLARALKLPVAHRVNPWSSTSGRGNAFSVIKTPLLSTDQELIGTLLMSYSHSVFAERYLETLKTLALITAALVLVLLHSGGGWTSTREPDDACHRRALSAGRNASGARHRRRQSPRSLRASRTASRAARSRVSSTRSPACRRN